MAVAASAASLVAAVQAIESDNQKEDRMRDAPDRTSVQTNGKNASLTTAEQVDRANRNGRTPATRL